MGSGIKAPLGTRRKPCEVQTPRVWLMGLLPSTPSLLVEQQHAAVEEVTLEIPFRTCTGDIGLQKLS